MTLEVNKKPLNLQSRWKLDDNRPTVLFRFVIGQMLSLDGGGDKTTWHNLTSGGHSHKLVKTCNLGVAPYVEIDKQSISVDIGGLRGP